MRLATGAPARVFPLVGRDAPGDVDDLRLCDGVCLVDSPRSANVLLVAGVLPEPLHEPARRIHDQMSNPRRTLWWARDPPDVAGAALFAEAMVVGAGDDLATALRRAQRELLTGQRASEAALRPDVDPAPWRGVGPYGQGGLGMTGGVPYGRPLAERASDGDGDGLELDQLRVRVGPFFPPFPTGLVLEIRLQGDIVQAVTLGDNPFVTPDDEAPHGPTGGGPASPFRIALARAVPIAELELARARHHLRWLAHALRIHGLAALGRRVLAMAQSVGPGMHGEVTALSRLLERTRALDWATARVGETEPERVAGRGLGPIARAAGVPEDGRCADPAYSALGFEPVLRQGGDARARWRQRLAEAAQSIELAAMAGDRLTGGGGRVESPRGLLTNDAAPEPTLLELVPTLLEGAEWGDAVTSVVSLDLDLRAAAAVRREAERGGTTTAEASR